MSCGSLAQQWNLQGEKSPSIQLTTKLTALALVNGETNGIAIVSMPVQKRLSGPERSGLKGNLTAHKWQDVVL